MSRDYSAEFMAGLIESVPEEGEFVPGVVAANAAEDAAAANAPSGRRQCRACQRRYQQRARAARATATT